MTSLVAPCSRRASVTLEGSFVPEGTKAEAGGEGGQAGLQGPDQQLVSDPNMGPACPEHKLPKTDSRAVVDIVASAGIAAAQGT